MGNATIQQVGPKQYQLTEPFDYVWWRKDGVTVFTIPAGFVYDLASVPRVVWALLSPLDLSFDAALLHDFCYRLGGRLPFDCISPWRTLTRAEVDRLFYDAMLEDEMKVSRVRAWLAYRAVRMFARFAWKG